MMKGIIDYRKYAATSVTKDDMCIVTKRGKNKIRKTTVVCQLLIQWREQSESWIHIKYLKESQPIEVSEFAKSQGIADETEFAWWVPCTMRKM